MSPTCVPLAHFVHFPEMMNQNVNEVQGYSPGQLVILDNHDPPVSVMCSACFLVAQWDFVACILKSPNFSH